MGSPSSDGQSRYFIGVGVGEYDDETLNLPAALSDVSKIAKWFTAESRTDHKHVLPELAENPTSSSILERFATFLNDCKTQDVLVIYIAAHGEIEGGRAYVFGRNTPRAKVAGRALEAGELGAIIGSNKPHNILLIVDACVAGVLGSAIQRAAETVSVEQNTRDPHTPYAQVIISSAFGRNPAHDGRFADAFLSVVRDERWTGTTTPWVSIDQVVRGLREAMNDLLPVQVVEHRSWGTGVAELIPNPSYQRLEHAKLINDEDFAAHFDPMSRGVVTRTEEGAFFRGREAELKRILAWLVMPPAQARDPMLVITGSPGCGKSALLARVAVLSDPERRQAVKNWASLTPGTVPPERSFDGVVWCHNKTAIDVRNELARALGGQAATPEALTSLARTRIATIALDALDEAAGGDAVVIVRQLLVPLIQLGTVRFLIATRRRAVHGSSNEKDLLAELGVGPAQMIDLNASASHESDLRLFVTARLEARKIDKARTARLTERIATAAQSSFLVASLLAKAPTVDGDDDAIALPSEVGEALASCLDRNPDPRWIPLLRPLAWATGTGIPWGNLWAPLATALDRVARGKKAVTFSDSDIRALLDQWGDLVVESVHGGQPVFRLFHEALAEHVRGDMDAVDAHAAYSSVLLEEASRQPWSQAQSYTVRFLPPHLLAGERFDQLVDVLGQPTWERAHRLHTGDPAAAVALATSTIDALLQRDPHDLRIVPLVVAYSRNMAAAEPLVIDVIARGGQLARAEALAMNLTYAVDRVIAFCQLAGIFAGENDLAGADRCTGAVERALTAVPPAHRSMAFSFLTQSALDSRQPERARTAAQDALAAALHMVQPDSLWELPNALFWAAHACRQVNDDEGLGLLREALDRSCADDARNQTLQAAAASGHRSFLNRHFELTQSGVLYRRTNARAGNLALAFVDAGMHEEAEALFKRVGAAVPSGEDDSLKRWAWALALSGRISQAVQAIGRIADTTERSKAIARITAIAREKQDQTALKALAKAAEELLASTRDSRARARLVRVLWQAGENGRALELAEDEIAAYRPRDEPSPQAPAPPRRGLKKRGRVKRKTGRRELPTSTVLVADERHANEAIRRATEGDIDGALQKLSTVGVPLYRARALAEVARRVGSRKRALALWLEALAVARAAGRSAVDEVLRFAKHFLPNAEVRDVNSSLANLDARWELEIFAEQYAALRRTRPPGADRTRRMTTLMLSPRRLAKARKWTKREVGEAWASGEDGKRLFVLGLMSADARLVVPEILIEGVRASRSAFEQYQALNAVFSTGPLPAKQAKLIHEAIRAERTGIPRLDGSPARIDEGTDRWELAEMIVPQRRAPKRT